MHDWNHDGKVDLLDGFIQDEIESRNTGNRSTGGGSGGGCITILLVPIIKNDNKSGDTSDLETEIDNILFNAFGLSEEEKNLARSFTGGESNG